MSHQEWDMRSDRSSGGLTAAQVARAAGTSESNIAAYERGDKTPNSVTFERILRLVQAGSSSPIFVNRLVTVPAAAAGLRRGLQDRRSTADLLRVVRESASNSRWVSRGVDVAAFFAPPSTTGDRRWDALLAGAVEDLTLRRHIAVPAWTVGHGLSTMWFVSESRAFDAYALANSPPSMKVRGVIMDPGDLVSV